MDQSFEERQTGKLTESQVSRRTLQKYLLFQIPGAVLVGFLLVGLYAGEVLSTTVAVAFFVGWCVKDALMYRFVRTAYGPGPLHGTAALVGMRGVVVDDLAPSGSVRLGAEQWSARCADEVSSLGRGTLVRVVSVEGFVLTVVEAVVEAAIEEQGQPVQRLTDSTSSASSRNRYPQTISASWSARVSS